MTDSTVDADAFNAFEAAGWEKQSAGYEDFFGPITTRVVEPLLDAAEVHPGARVLDVASGPATWPPRPPSAARRSLAWTSPSR